MEGVWPRSGQAAPQPGVPALSFEGGILSELYKGKGPTDSSDSYRDIFYVPFWVRSGIPTSDLVLPPVTVAL